MHLVGLLIHTLQYDAWCIHQINNTNKAETFSVHAECCHSSTSEQRGISWPTEYKITEMPHLKAYICSYMNIWGRKDLNQVQDSWHFIYSLSMVPTSDINTLKYICLAYLHSIKKYGIIFFGNTSNNWKISLYKRKSSELWQVHNPEPLVKIYLNN